MPSSHLPAGEVIFLHSENILKPRRRKLRSADLPDERDGPACYAFLVFKAYERHSVDALNTQSQDAEICQVPRTEKTLEVDKLTPLVAEA